MPIEIYTASQALDALTKYCAYQERSQAEARKKMYGFQITSDEKEWVIAQLIEQDFLSESRFAELYVRSKINQKKWGVLKLKQGLFMHGVSQPIVNKELQQCKNETYRNNAIKLLEKILSAKEATQDLKVRIAIRKLQSKGYEPAWVGALIKATYKLK